MHKKTDRLVYQMEVEGQVTTSLASANQNIPNANWRGLRYFLLVIMILIIGTRVVIAMDIKTYKRQYRELAEKQEMRE